MAFERRDVAARARAASRRHGRRALLAGHAPGDGLDVARGSSRTARNAGVRFVGLHQSPGRRRHGGGGPERGDDPRSLDRERAGRAPPLHRAGVAIVITDRPDLAKAAAQDGASGSRCPDAPLRPGARPGHDGLDGARGRSGRRGARARLRRAAASTSRGRAGSSTIPRRSGRPRADALGRGARAARACSPAEIAAIGITNQRETTILWERASGRPVHNAIVWQCRRTAPLCEALKAEGAEPEFRRQDRASSSIRTSRAPRSAGSSTRCRARGSAPSAASSPSAPWTRGSSGGSPAAPCTPPIRPTPRARSASTSARSTGTRGCAGASACPMALLPRVLPSAGVFGETAAGVSARRHSGGGNRRRPAGRALRPGLPRAGHGQEHLRHRMLRAAQHGARRPSRRSAVS